MASPFAPGLLTDGPGVTYRPIPGRQGPRPSGPHSKPDETPRGARCSPARQSQLDSGSPREGKESPKTQANRRQANCAGARRRREAPAGARIGEAEGDMLTPLLLLVLLLPASHARVCPPCGKTAVPYPLSTGDGCGDPAYKVRCARSGNSSTLVFDALNGASYPITSVTPAAQRLVVSPAPFVPRGSCVSEGAVAGRGVQLSASLPFNVSSSNTIMLLNCTRDLQLSPLDCSSNSLCHAYADLLLSPLDCSSDSPCHAYANATGSTASACAPLPLCCTFVAGGSSTSYSIPVSPRFCSAYRSFVGLDPTTQPPQTWGSRLGLELQWATPREPLCRTQADCEDGAKATCGDDPLDTASGGAGKVRRCFCIRALTWNPLAGACQLNRNCGGSNNVAAAIAVGVCIGFVPLLAAIAVLFVHCRRQRVSIPADNGRSTEEEEAASSVSGPAMKEGTASSSLGPVGKSKPHKGAQSVKDLVC